MAWMCLLSVCVGGCFPEAAQGGRELACFGDVLLMNPTSFPQTKPVSTCKSVQGQCSGDRMSWFPTAQSGDNDLVMSSCGLQDGDQSPALAILPNLTLTRTCTRGWPQRSRLPRLPWQPYLDGARAWGRVCAEGQWGAGGSRLWKAPQHTSQSQRFLVACWSPADWEAPCGSQELGLGHITVRSRA